MMQFACPLAFAALLLPLIVWYAVPAAKGLHGDALRVPFLRDLAKINLKSGSIWGGLRTGFYLKRPPGQPFVGRQKSGGRIYR